MRHGHRGPPVARPPDGTLVWRREPASNADLTPIGRLLFADGSAPLTGYRLAPAILLTAASAFLTLFMLAGAALTVAGVVWARRADIVPAVLCACLYVGLAIAAIRVTMRTALDPRRLGTWTAPTAIAWRDGVWVDAVRETRRGILKPVVVRRLVRWSADCPTCGASMRLVERDRRGRTPPAGVCAMYPFQHHCTFDHGMWMGHWWNNDADADRRSAPMTGA